MELACPQEEDQSLRNLVVKFEAEKLYQPFHNNVTEYLEAANRKLTRGRSSLILVKMFLEISSNVFLL